jgi:two-component system sporulation sensor kinase A
VAVLCAPILIPGGALVVLKLSARREGLFGEYEARLVEEFIPITSLAVQFLVRTETLHERVLESERKHVLANLTRGITHDVNNALGAMMPLVQQMREDATNNQLEAETVTQDLQSLEASIQTCRRIFGSMLTISRGAVRGVGHGNLRRAIDGALNVLEDSLKRRNIQVLLDLPDELPTIRGSQGDLTQIFLNLCTNARDAMSDGGELHIIATPNKKTVRVSVQDTGCGIPAEKLTRVLEPFYTTKAEGSGLGLSICRSVLYDIGGDLTVHSTEGEGTRLNLTLPVLPVQENAE